MFVEERLAKILESLEETGQVDVCKLAEEFEVSKETVRRDLNRLEREHRLVRTHGGAISNGFRVAEDTTVYNAGISGELPANVRASVNASEKEIIGRKAASFIQDGDTIFVDNSTSCTYMYPYIPKDMQVTIITNSVQFLLRCIKNVSSSHTIICLGGILKQSNSSLYGNLTLKSAVDYFPNKAFVGCTGILSKTQVTDMGVQEIDIKKALMAASREVFLLADHSKFKTSGQVFLSSLSDIDYVITDSKADYSYLGLTPEMEKRIVIAE